MTRARLNKGFHRLGLVLAAPLVAFAMFGAAVVLTGNSGTPAAAMILVAETAIGAVAVYVVCRVLAWIAAGFMGE